MDLSTLISQSSTRIKKNWILFIPPFLTQVVVPILLITVATLTLFPLAMAFSLSGDFWGVIQTVAVGAAILAIVGLLIDTFMSAGWAYMNKRVVVDGQTTLDDLWVGAKKYFSRILGGRILVGVIVAVPILAGIAAVAASIVALNVGQFPPRGELAPEAIIGLLGPIAFRVIGIFVIIGVIELILYIFLLPWMQALVMEDLGIWESVKASFLFVRRNFATTIAYIAIAAVAWVAASWLMSFFWPSLSYSELTRPSTYMDPFRMLGLLLGAGSVIGSVVSALLSAFFTLLLFLIYADRTRGLLPPARSSDEVSRSVVARRQPARRGMKYCVNCVAAIISLAVFCPNCGARQPPLPPQ